MTDAEIDEMQTQMTYLNDVDGWWYRCARVVQMVLLDIHRMLVVGPFQLTIVAKYDGEAPPEGDKNE